MHASIVSPDDRELFTVWSDDRFDQTGLEVIAGPEIDWAITERMAYRDAGAPGYRFEHVGDAAGAAIYRLVAAPGVVAVVGPYAPVGGGQVYVVNHEDGLTAVLNVAAGALLWRVSRSAGDPYRQDLVVAGEDGLIRTAPPHLLLAWLQRQLPAEEGQ